MRRHWGLALVLAIAGTGSALAGGPSGKGPEVAPKPVSFEGNVKKVEPNQITVDSLILGFAAATQPTLNGTAVKWSDLKAGDTAMGKYLPSADKTRIAGTVANLDAKRAKVITASPTVVVHPKSGSGPVSKSIYVPRDKNNGCASNCSALTNTLMCGNPACDCCRCEVNTN